MPRNARPTGDVLLILSVHMPGMILRLPLFSVGSA